tara:strand:- start:5965 stop:6219 length:255 start_codon:yes stop_codon:yes gene_type:complete
MSQLIYEASSVGVMTVLFGNVIACVLDFAILSPKLKTKLPLMTSRDNFYQMGILLFLTGVSIHLFCELVGLNRWYCKEGFACKR